MGPTPPGVTRGRWSADRCEVGFLDVQGSLSIVSEWEAPLRRTATSCDIGSSAPYGSGHEMTKELTEKKKAKPGLSEKQILRRSYKYRNH